MTFSIVIPTYNGADFIEQALLSALNQSRPADEIVISDDNSSDDTLAICQKYTDRIKIYRNLQGPSGLESCNRKSYWRVYFNSSSRRFVSFHFFGRSRKSISCLS